MQCRRSVLLHPPLSSLSPPSGTCYRRQEQSVPRLRFPPPSVLSSLDTSHFALERGRRSSVVMNVRYRRTSTEHQVHTADSNSQVAERRANSCRGPVNRATHLLRPSSSCCVVHSTQGSVWPAAGSADDTRGTFVKGYNDGLIAGFAPITPDAILRSM